MFGCDKEGLLRTMLTLDVLVFIMNRRKQITMFDVYNVLRPCQKGHIFDLARTSSLSSSHVNAAVLWQVF